MTSATCVINLGLKSMRAAVFDADGTRRAIAYRPIESRMGEGRVEQDPEDWWRASRKAIHKALQDGNVDAASIRAVGLSGQMHGAVLLDSDDQVVRPAIIW